MSLDPATPDLDEVEVWRTTDGHLSLIQESEDVELDEEMQEQLRALLNGEGED